MSQTFTAGWYLDPAGQHERRWFDGSQWTEHVSSHGRPSISPLTGAPSRVPTVDRATEKVRDDVRRTGIQAGPGSGGGHLFTETVLVVNQKAKLIEVNQEFAVYDQHGTQLGAVRQVGQSSMKKALRFVSNVDQFLTHTLQVVDMAGVVLLVLTRPAKLVKSRVVVRDGAGHQVGEIVQQNAIGKIRFALQADAVTVGSINAENWRAWNFRIDDASGREVARITKTWEGLAKTMFTTADNYVVHIDSQVAGPLRLLVVASALSVDTALKQDSRGMS